MSEPSKADHAGAWRYEVQHGPEGEANYAWVYDENNNRVCTAKTHHAMAMVDGPRLSAAAEQMAGALEQWLTYASDALSEFDLADCDQTETLCPRCEPTGCIYQKIQKARAALSSWRKATGGAGQ